MMNHPYRLRRIELQDFKSVAQASVKLRPLTVVVGANSSGKSTLLQSILAVTQAVRTGANAAEFPLNGEFVRLGTFDETRNFATRRPEEPMQVAFELVTQNDLRVPANFNPGDEEAPHTQLVWRAYISDTGAEAELTGGTSGFAHLSGLQIEVSSLLPEGEVERVLSCDVSEFATSEGSTPNLGFAGMHGAYFDPGARPINVSGRVQDWDSGASSAIDAVVLRGGVPWSLLRRVRLLDRRAETWWNEAQDVLSEEIGKQREVVAEKGQPKQLKLDAVTQAEDDIGHLEAEGRDGSRSESAPTRGLRAFLELFEGVESRSRLLGRAPFPGIQRLSAEERTNVARSMVHLGEAAFRRHLREKLINEPWIDEEILVEASGEVGRVLAQCSLFSRDFFGRRVRYLGPLREAPNVLYDPAPSKLDLGVRGEYSAAVLHAQAHQMVLMPTPDGDGELQRLDTALDWWLREFGLADRAHSEDRGRIGIGLSVTPKGLDREVDLTSVGVGVSQVLPVILLCLLGEPGTLLVLEQPELHLHPTLQQDLADFLLACARSGRQIVLETHSEHLVNRLRYRIAKDETDETHELVGLIFAENDNGETRYREPDINVYGGLGDDWPAGFLDLTALEAKELIRASLAKRERDGSLGTSSEP